VNVPVTTIVTLAVILIASLHSPNAALMSALTPSIAINGFATCSYILDCIDSSVSFVCNIFFPCLICSCLTCVFASPDIGDTLNACSMASMECDAYSSDGRTMLWDLGLCGWSVCR